MRCFYLLSFLILIEYKENYSTQGRMAVNIEPTGLEPCIFHMYFKNTYIWTGEKYLQAVIYTA